MQFKFLACLTEKLHSASSLNALNELNLFYVVYFLAGKSVLATLLFMSPIFYF
jgi:hypothetical protein